MLFNQGLMNFYSFIAFPLRFLEFFVALLSSPTATKQEKVSELYFGISNDSDSSLIIVIV